MGGKRRRVEVVDLSDLREDPDNARLHPSRNRAAIRASVDQFGAARSVVIDGDGVVRAGNGALRAAAENGIQKVVVVEVDGEELVAVRRSDWTPEQARAYAITDNKASDLSRFRFETVAEQIPGLQDAGIDLETLGWRDYELRPLADADWTPPAATPGGLDVDTSKITKPIRLTVEQRRVFDEAMEASNMTEEGDLVEKMSREFLNRRGGRK